MFYNVFLSRDQVFQWCPVYLRNGIHVMNNPSHTSCMSIFIFLYEFCNSLVATTGFYNVFRWSALGDFRDVLSTFAIAVSSQTTLPILRVCRFSFPHSNLSIRWTQWRGCLSYFATLQMPLDTQCAFRLMLLRHSVVQSWKTFCFRKFAAFVYSPLGRPWNEPFSLFNVYREPDTKDEPSRTRF